MKKLTRGLLAAAVAVFVAIGASSTAYYILRSNGAQANAPSSPGAAGDAGVGRVRRTARCRDLG